jgi:hypothetical protein
MLTFSRGIRRLLQHCKQRQSTSEMTIISFMHFWHMPSQVRLLRLRKLKGCQHSRKRKLFHLFLSDMCTPCAVCRLQHVKFASYKYLSKPDSPSSVHYQPIADSRCLSGASPSSSSTPFPREGPARKLLGAAAALHWLICMQLRTPNGADSLQGAQ